jgi:hypothetical protein
MDYNNGNMNNVPPMNNNNSVPSFNTTPNFNPYFNPYFNPHYNFYQSAELSLIQKNIELLSNQVKLLDSKVSLLIESQNRNNNKRPNQYQNRNYNKRYQNNNRNYNRKRGSNNINKPKPMKEMYPINNSPDNIRNKKTPNKGTKNKNMIIQLERINPSQLKNLADGKPTKKSNIIEHIVPMDGLMDSLTTIFGELEKDLANNKSKDEVDEDYEQSEDISEYGSEIECEELSIEIQTLDDLIELGEMYDKLKEEGVVNMDVSDDIMSDKEETDSNSSDNSKPDKENDDILSKINKEIDEKISKELDEIATEIEQKSSKDDISDKVEKDEVGEEEQNVDETEEEQNEANKKVEKKKNSTFYELNGKKYSLNLEILNNLLPSLYKLKAMVGLDVVKNSIIDMILYYLQNFERRNNNMLHTVIEGPPGVGKTELGKIFAEIYATLGIIKSNKVKFVRRTDLVGEYLGHTAHKTQQAIDDADGGVLFIDEAYALGNEEKRDSFAKECIDTLNQNLSENKRKFICIIAGYPDELDKCFFSYNPGLKRRFPFRYQIEGYSPDELRDIFLKKITDIKWKLNEDDMPSDKITEFFKTNIKEFPHFGGDVENLIVECKFMHSRRVVGKHPKYRRKLTKDDINDGLNRYITNKKKDTTSEVAYSMYN